MTVTERILQLALAADASRLEAEKAAHAVSVIGEECRRSEQALKEATRSCLHRQHEALRRYEALSATLAATILRPEEASTQETPATPEGEGGAGW